MRAIAICVLLAPIASTAVAQDSHAAGSAGPLLYDGVGRLSTQQEFRSVFTNLACKRAAGRETVDITCSGRSRLASAPAQVTAGIWKEGAHFRLYELELRIPRAHRDDLLRTLGERYGPPTTAGASVESTWAFGDGLIRLKESPASDPLLLQYSWDLSASETAERRDSIGHAHAPALATHSRMAGKDF